MAAAPIGHVRYAGADTLPMESRCWVALPVLYRT